eukprot:scaffold189_cov118-Isochrysis_galbana.AAC.13
MAAGLAARRSSWWRPSWARHRNPGHARCPLIRHQVQRSTLTIAAGRPFGLPAESMHALRASASQWLGWALSGHRQGPPSTPTPTHPWPGKAGGRREALGVRHVGSVGLPVSSGVIGRAVGHHLSFT